MAAPERSAFCFGHQLIAQALGGAVGRAAAGWGVGVHTWKVVRDESWMRPAKREFRLLASHQDQVKTLPSGARLLASSKFCPHAAFAVGEHMLAVQGHPEFTKAYAEFLMHKRRPLLGAAFEPGLRSLINPPMPALSRVGLRRSWPAVEADQGWK